MQVTKTDAGLYAVEVDGHTYEFEKWGAEDALDTLMDITSVVGTPLSAAAAAAFGKGGQGEQTELTDGLIERVMGELTANMRQQKAMCMTVFKKLAGRRVLCDGRKVDFDTHYMDSLQTLFLVVRAAFEVQYGSFFAAVFGGRGALPAKAPPLTQG